MESLTNLVCISIIKSLFFHFLFRRCRVSSRGNVRHGPRVWCYHLCGRGPRRGPVRRQGRRHRRQRRYHAQDGHHLRNSRLVLNFCHDVLKLPFLLNSFKGEQKAPAFCVSCHVCVLSVYGSALFCLAVVVIALGISSHVCHPTCLQA